MSELQFQQNMNNVVAPKRFKSFYGRVINNMQPLLKGLEKDSNGKLVQKDVERFPADIKTIAYERVHSSNKNDRNLLRDHYFVTSVGFAQNPRKEEGYMIILPSNPVFRETIEAINPESNFPNGLLKISDEDYHKIREAGSVMNISKEDATTLKNRAYDIPEFREEVVDFVLQNDSDLKKDYIKNISGNMKNNFGLWFTSRKGWGLVWFGSVGNNNSNINCNNNLNNNNGRLLGIVRLL